MATTLGTFRGMGMPCGAARPSRPIATRATGSQSLHAKPAVVGLLVPRHWVCPDPALPGRASLRIASSDTGAEGDDQLVGDKGQVLQGKQEQPTMREGAANGMGSEEKKGDTPAQGGAPEGDRAAEAQPEGQLGSELTGQAEGGHSPGAQPEAGDKMPDQSAKSSSETASEEAKQQEDRAPLQD